MKGNYETQGFSRIIGWYISDLWHYFRYYFVAPENCPRCQGESPDGDREEKCQ